MPGIRVKVNVQGQAELLELFNRARVAFPGEDVQKAILPAARLIRDDAARRVARGPAKRKVGTQWMRDARKHLSELIFAAYGRRGASNVIVGVDLKKAPHAHLVEFGTSPHIIKPRAPNRFLFLADRFVTSVQHPGAKKKPFLRPAIQSQRRKVFAEMEIALRKLFDSKVRGFGQ